MGQFGFGEMDENGLLFAELWDQPDVVIDVTLFRTSERTEHSEEVLNKPPYTLPRSLIGGSSEGVRSNNTAPSQRHISASILTIKPPVQIASNRRC